MKGKRNKNVNADANRSRPPHNLQTSKEPNSTFLALANTKSISIDLSHFVCRLLFNLPPTMVFSISFSLSQSMDRFDWIFQRRRTSRPERRKGANGGADTAEHHFEAVSKRPECHGNSYGHRVDRRFVKQFYR
eukprot:CAMPEP_0116093520 /NCGR_PEP_ID=MMETSP0327-20121206/8642_1 /TAXON_ID=44447 /ORGANISM="Pseudo-nitzschia delicatissima, Strain B596" /LENGTH=132 /DNA_ID=CAMNT_0003585063 /DNA_START=49 /DNA_END=447 /DNA_ORIENTATION=-